eukprot:7632682-Pyramimonas_sp.AAC.1
MSFNILITTAISSPLSVFLLRCPRGVAGPEAAAAAGAASWRWSCFLRRGSPSASPIAQSACLAHP